MGNFICSVVILALILLFTVINSSIICNLCDEMIELTDAEKWDEACQLWRSKRGYIALFVRDAEIDVVNAAVDKFSSETPIEDGEAETRRTSLKEALLEVKHSESAGWASIF